ncbi:MAG: hypothetical protein KC493_07335 [Bacteriovoracaceae bacterium]|nr:hypothetical protein [Bacteriovoracaceae bacterium]
MKAYRWPLLALSCLFLIDAHSMDRRGRLGAGFSNQMKNNIPSVSFKLQKSKSFAFGGVFGINTDASSGGTAGGLKLYRNIFDEPQLNFYASSLIGFLAQKRSSGDQSGFQVDLTMGSEFSFAGLSSLGFSVEFGVSLNKVDEFVVETVGENFIVAGAHFYL